MNGLARFRPYRGRSVVLLCTEEPLDFLALQVIYCLNSSGARVHLVSDGRAPIYRYSRYCQAYKIAPFPRDLRDVARFGAWLEDYAKRCDAFCVISSEIESTILLARLKSQGCPIPCFPIAEPATIELLHDKWRFAEFLAENDVPQPRSVGIGSMGKDVLDKVAGLTLPLMIKPTNLSGGRGVHRIDSIDQIQKLANAEQHDMGAVPLVAQEYIPGEDMGVSLLATDGTVVAYATYSRWIDGQDTTEFDEISGALEIGRKVAEKLAFTGVLQIDLRRDERDGRLLPIECNPRFWFTVSHAMWQGLNFVELGLAMHEGWRPDRAVTCSPGRIYPRRELLRRQFKAGALSQGNRRALRQLLADPLPLLYPPAYRLLRKLRSRIAPH